MNIITTEITIMVLTLKENRMTIRIKIHRKEANGITQNKMIQPGTRRYQAVREKLARNQNGKIVR